MCIRDSPILLDNGFGMSLLGALNGPQDETPRLPFSVERLRWWRAPIGRVFGGSVERAHAGDAAASDFVLIDEDGEVLTEVEGFLCRKAQRELFLRQESQASDTALYRLE